MLRNNYSMISDPKINKRQWHQSTQYLLASILYLPHEFAEGRHYTSDKNPNHARRYATEVHAIMYVHVMSKKCTSIKKFLKLCERENWDRFIQHDDVNVCANQLVATLKKISEKSSRRVAPSQERTRPLTFANLEVPGLRRALWRHTRLKQTV